MGFHFLRINGKGIPTALGQIEIVVVVACALFVTDREKWLSPGFLIAVFIIILAVGLPFRIIRRLKK